MPSGVVIDLLFCSIFSGVTSIVANSSINSTNVSVGLSSFSAVSVSIRSSSHDNYDEKVVYQCLLVTISKFLVLGFLGSF